jgi:hypothetical protein
MVRTTSTAVIAIHPAARADTPAVSTTGAITPSGDK